jgi:hypothetical protein
MSGSCRDAGASAIGTALASLAPTKPVQVRSNLIMSTFERRRIEQQYPHDFVAEPDQGMFSFHEWLRPASVLSSHPKDCTGLHDRPGRGRADHERFDRRGIKVMCLRVDLLDANCGGRLLATRCVITWSGPAPISVWSQRAT